VPSHHGVHNVFDPLVMSASDAVCAVPHCGEEDEALLVAVCTNGHYMHSGCLKQLVSVGRQGENDGETTSILKCPLCRDETVLSAWGSAFEYISSTAAAASTTTTGLMASDIYELAQMMTRNRYSSALRRRGLAATAQGAREMNVTVHRPGQNP